MIRWVLLVIFSGFVAIVCICADYADQYAKAQLLGASSVGGTAGYTPPVILQTIAGFAPTTGSCTQGATGSACATEVATMTPASPGFVGTWALVASNAACANPVDTADFLIGAATGIITLNSAVAAGTYYPCVRASQIAMPSFYQQVAITINSGSSVPAAANAGCLTINGGGPTNGSCFATLALSMDFTGATQSFVGGSGGSGGNFNATTTSNWLDCAGAATPVWYAGSPSVCNTAYHIINDGGTDVLDLTVTPTMFSSGIQNLFMLTGPVNRNGGGTSIPQQFYVEFKMRVPTSSDTACTNSPNCIESDVWSYTSLGGTGPGTQAMELDFIEMYGNSNEATQGFIENGGTPNGAYSPSGQHVTPSNPSGYNHNVYNIFGERVTEDGNGNVDVCFYVNNAQVSGSCQTGNMSTSLETGAYNQTIPLNIYVTGGAQLATGLSGNVDAYIQWIHLYSCKNWTQAYTPPGGPAGTGNACTGVLLMTNP